jgi:hypothetical protein
MISELKKNEAKEVKGARDYVTQDDMPKKRRVKQKTASKA